MHLQSFTLILLAVVTALGTQRACAQSTHSDVIFEYSDAKIELLPGAGQEFSPQRVWTGEWDVDGFFKQDTTQPGWASEAVSGHGIGAADIVVYNVLDDLLYWNNGAFSPPAAQVQVRILNNGQDNGVPVPNTLISYTSGPQPGSVSSPLANTIGQADGIGDFHKHVRYKLEHQTGATPAFGAYGLSLSLSSNAPGVVGSDPFFLVFNFGLSEQDFAAAANAYATLLAPSLPGDFNQDGRVDAADYTVWRDGNFTPADYLVWRSHYGQTLTNPAAASAIPTPGCAGLLLATVPFYFIRRKACP